MSEFEPNPAWVDKVFRTYGRELAARVGADLLPTTSKEYGCGHYGCVYPTSRPDVVVKVTSDATEAAFVAAALSLGEMPEGIVHYKHLFQVPESYRRRPVFVLWREDARDVGKVTAYRVGSEDDPAVQLGLRKLNVDANDQESAYERQARRELANRLTQFKGYASLVRKAFVDSNDWPAALADAKRMEDWAWREVSIDEFSGTVAGISRMRGAQRLAAAIRACEIVAELMATEYASADIGSAFEFYMQHGMLLADVHHNNVGRVVREHHSRPFWVITDPGHMVPLDPKWMTVEVEQLPRPV